MSNARCYIDGMTSAEFFQILKTGTPDEQRAAREAMAAQLIAQAAERAAQPRTIGFGKAPRGGWTDADRVK